jgi:hypothetical protein
MFRLLPDWQFVTREFSHCASARIGLRIGSIDTYGQAVLQGCFSIQILPGLQKPVLALAPRPCHCGAHE